MVYREALTGTNYQAPAPITLMYQAGYLTIKGYDQVFETYYLDYPNDEVKTCFMKSLSEFFAPKLRLAIIEFHGLNYFCNHSYCNRGYKNIKTLLRSF